MGASLGALTSPQMHAHGADDVTSLEFVELENERSRATAHANSSPELIARQCWRPTSHVEPLANAFPDMMRACRAGGPYSSELQDTRLRKVLPQVLS